jgi:hypothetical protein
MNVGSRREAADLMYAHQMSHPDHRLQFIQMLDDTYVIDCSDCDEFEDKPDTWELVRP